MRYPWAVPGRKVVCVDAFGVEDEPRVKEGATYEIRSVGVETDGWGQTVVAIKLKGIRRSECPFTGIRDMGFRASRFRPLHTVETDVALFAGLLTPAPNEPMLPTKEYTTT